MRYFTILLVILMGYSHAHPVIYKNGWVYQGSFMPQMNEMRVGYTFDPKWSVVANSHRFENNKNYRDYTLGFNYLAKRWLQQDSQGNLYLGAHYGNYKDNLGDGQVGHAFAMADWEDRDDYFVFKTKRFYYDDKETQDYMFRYGFAPYVAGMNELQSWMIFQAYYYEEQSRKVLITPMIRFFYRNVLWEIGSSTKGDAFLTLMIHY
jgi:hypothetical protein